MTESGYRSQRKDILRGPNNKWAEYFFMRVSRHTRRRLDDDLCIISPSGYGHKAILRSIWGAKNRVYSRRWFSGDVLIEEVAAHATSKRLRGQKEYHFNISTLINIKETGENPLLISQRYFLDDSIYRLREKRSVFVEPHDNVSLWLPNGVSNATWGNYGEIEYEGMHIANYLGPMELQRNDVVSYLSDNKDPELILVKDI
jgi:hypothetical protein